MREINKPSRDHKQNQTSAISIIVSRPFCMIIGLVAILMFSLTACNKSTEKDPNTLNGGTAGETVIKMELDANYDESDPFVNERLFCISDNIEILDAAGSFQMDGESAVVEIKDNETDEVLWSNTWQGSVDREAFTISLENMQKDREYVVCFTGTGINHAAASISFESDLVRELERPGLLQTTAPPAAETPAAEGTTTDYPAAIMVEGSVYLLSAEPMSEEVDESAVIGYTKSYTDAFPEKNGETNFNRTLDMPYAKVENGIAVLYEDKWYLCTPRENGSSDLSNEDLKSENLFCSFSAQKTDSNYEMEGTVYLSSERDLVRARSTGDTEISVSGTLKRQEGEVKLLFEDNDGNTTTLIDSTNNQEDTIEIDLSLPLDEGNGRFYFSGSSSIFDFDLSFDLQEGVDYFLNNR